MRRLVLALTVMTASMAVMPIAMADPEEGITEKPVPQPTVPTTHEYLNERPSGFWTSNRPAMGGAYRYRLLIVGIGVAGIMGFVLYRTITKANRQSARK